MAWKDAPVVLPDDVGIAPEAVAPEPSAPTFHGLALSPETELLIRHTRETVSIREPTREEARRDALIRSSRGDDLGPPLGRLRTSVTLGEDGRFLVEPDWTPLPRALLVISGKTGHLYDTQGRLYDFGAATTGPGHWLPWQVIADGVRHPMTRLSHVEEWSTLFSSRRFLVRLASGGALNLRCWPELSTMRELYADDGYYRALARFNEMLKGTDCEVVAMVGAYGINALSGEGAFVGLNKPALAGRDPRYVGADKFAIASYGGPVWCVWLRYAGVLSLQGNVWVDPDGLFLMSSWCQREGAHEAAKIPGSEAYHGGTMQHTLLTWAMGPGSLKLAEQHPSYKKFSLRPLRRVPSPRRLFASSAMRLARALCRGWRTGTPWTVERRTPNSRYAADKLAFSFESGYELPYSDEHGRSYGNQNLAEMLRIGFEPKLLGRWRTNVALRVGDRALHFSVLYRPVTPIFRVAGGTAYQVLFGLEPESAGAAAVEGATTVGLELALANCPELIGLFHEVWEEARVAPGHNKSWGRQQLPQWEEVKDYSDYFHGIAPDGPVPNPARCDSCGDLRSRCECASDEAELDEDQDEEGPDDDQF